MGCSRHPRADTYVNNDRIRRCGACKKPLATSRWLATCAVVTAEVTRRRTKKRTIKLLLELDERRAAEKLRVKWRMPKPVQWAAEGCGKCGARKLRGTKHVCRKQQKPAKRARTSVAPVSAAGFKSKVIECFHPVVIFDRGQRECFSCNKLNP